MFLGSSAWSEEAQADLRIVKYVEDNSSRWLEFATGLGIGLKEEQILFVSGTTKTTSWGVVAFRGKTRSLRGTVSGNIGPMVAADFSVTITGAQLSTLHCKAGPPSSTDHVSPQRDNYDQCIFIRFYKQKRKILHILSALKPGPGLYERPRKTDKSGYASIVAEESTCVRDTQVEEFPEQHMVSRFSRHM